MSSEKVFFLKALVCEDIRREADGRYSLMGVISNGITFQSDRDIAELDIPKIDLAFYVEFKLSHSAKLHFRFLKEGSDAAISNLSAVFDKQEDESDDEVYALPIVRSQFDFSEAGTYAIQGRADDSEWQSITRICVDFLGAMSDEAIND